MPHRWCQANVNVLLLRKRQQFIEALLAPKAGLLVAAEGGTEKVRGNLVDPDKACRHTLGSAVRRIEVACPDGAGESIFKRIDLIEQDLGVLPPQHAQYRSEDLFTRD